MTQRNGTALATRVAALVILGTAGCIYSNDSLRADLQRRASYDMACGQPQLVLTPLGMSPSGFIHSYGVSGCGHRGTYVLLNTGVWALNAGDQGQTMGTGAPPAPAPR